MFEAAGLVALPPSPHPHTSLSVFAGLISVRTVITLQKAIKYLLLLEVYSGMNLLWILHNYDKLYM